MHVHVPTSELETRCVNVFKVIYISLHGIKYDIIHGQCNNVKAYDILSHEINTGNESNVSNEKAEQRIFSTEVGVINFN